MKSETLSLRRIHSLNGCTEAKNMYKKYYSGCRSVTLDEIAKKCADEHHCQNIDAAPAISWLARNKLLNLGVFVPAYFAAGGNWDDLWRLLPAGQTQNDILFSIPEKERKPTIYRSFRTDNIQANQALLMTRNTINRAQKMAEWSWNETSECVTATRKEKGFDLKISAELINEYPDEDSIVFSDKYQNKHPFIKIKSPPNRGWREDYIYFYNTNYFHRDGNLHQIRCRLQEEYVNYLRYADSIIDTRDIHVTASACDLLMGRSFSLSATSESNSAPLHIFEAVEEYDMVEEAIENAEKKMNELASLIAR